MTKIFGYECRRLLGNKIFWGLSAVTLWYAWRLLTNEIVWGVANTAPFSPWSFGYYLSCALPFLCAVELFFISFFTSKDEGRVAVLTAATPVNPRTYMWVRCGTVLMGSGILTLCVTALGLGYYVSLFGAVPLAELVFPAVMTLLPTLILALGCGWFLGRLHPGLVYVLMAVFFLLPYLPLPPWITPISTTFFASYPASLGTLDPGFTVPAALLTGRLIMLLLGITLLGLDSASRSRGYKNT